MWKGSKGFMRPYNEHESAVWCNNCQSSSRTSWMTYWPTFCPSHRRMMALVAPTDHLHRQLEWGGSVLLLLLDFTGAFNTFDHNLLTHSLTSIGVCGVVLQCLIWFFQGQRQSVVLGELFIYLFVYYFIKFLTHPFLKVQGRLQQNINN